MARPTRCDSCTRPLQPDDQYCRECGAVVPWNIPTGAHEASPPVAFLLVHLPGGIVRKEPLSSPRVRIGRSNRCEVVVDHPRVSRHHATLELREGAYHIEDARSTGGTFLNDRPLHGSVRLASGDTFRLGRLREESVSVVYHEAGRN